MAEYSFTPQFANLAGIQPLPAIDVTGGGALQFQPLQAIEVPSARPELVGAGIASAIERIGSGVLSGITAKYEEKKEAEREQLKYQKELELEREKRKTSLADFVQQELIKKTIASGAEADFPEQIQRTVTRLKASVPQAFQTAPEEPTVVIPPTAEKKLTTPQEGALAIDAATPLPEMEGVLLDTVEPPPTVVTKPTTLEMLPPPAIPKVPAEPPAPLTPIAPPISAPLQIPQQPKDPSQPRNIRGLVFSPTDFSGAWDTASKLTTPYWKVVPEQDKRTLLWFLKMEDRGEEVRNAGIEGERLAMEKNKADLDRQKIEFEQLAAKREQLKKDDLLLKTQKNNIQTESNKLSFIDRAIEKLESDPELSGFLTEYYLGKANIPFVPASPKDWAAVAKIFGFDLGDRVQQIIDLQKDLETISANLGWQAFAQMKELSPSGTAGVGGLTEGERQSLERIPGSLDITQSSQNLIKNLYNLRNGATKTIANASSQIQQVDPAFERPRLRRLKTSSVVKDEISRMSKALEREKKKGNENTQAYKNTEERMQRLIEEEDALDKFNQSFGLQ